MNCEEQDACGMSCQSARVAESPESQNSGYDSSRSLAPPPNRTMQSKRLHLWNQVALLVSISIFISSFNVCQSFAPTPCTTTPCPGARKHATILHVVETEAPSAPHHTATKIQPHFSYSSIPPVCEQDERDGIEEESKVEDAVAESEKDQYTEDEGAERKTRLGKAEKAAVLLSRRKGSHKRNASIKSTSVGDRRVGTASRARRGVGSMTRIADAVRHSAGASILKKPSSPDKLGKDDGQPLSSRITQSTIRSTVNDMIKASGRSMGLLGEASATTTYVREITSTPPPGTVLVECPKNSRWKASDRVCVRVATASDDLDIANLRLSVFSSFSPSMRQAFCSRSCHVLATRRNQGATCIVATVPRYGSILSTRKDIVLGTAECSVHEFYGTELGSRRHQTSILYITEVAVSPTARRKGIGGKIMQSIDEMARIRGVESLYLHVDVTNRNALSLYEGAGYQIVPSDNPVFSEFTKSLNLHDGAMKGRNHYLMQKDLGYPTWLPDHQTTAQRGTLGIEISS